MTIIGMLVAAPVAAWADYPGTTLSGTTDVRHGGHGRAPGFERRIDIFRSPDDTPWRNEAGITLLDGEVSAGTGVNAGPLRDGRAVVARGEHGEVAVEAGRLWGRVLAGAGASPSGAVGRVHFDSAATVAGVFAGTKVYGAGDVGAGTWVNASGFGVAFVGGEANGDLIGRVGRSGAALRARAGGFAGAKAVALGFGTASFCGASTHARGGASVSAGVGGEAALNFRLDWATLSLSVGGDLSATLGLGAGVGGEVEVSLEGIVRDPRGSARCVNEAVVARLRAGANSVRGAIDSLLCLLCERTSDTSGVATARNARTRPVASGDSTRATAGSASDAGTAR